MKLTDLFNLFLPQPQHLRGLTAIKLPVNELWQRVQKERNLELAFEWLCKQDSLSPPQSPFAKGGSSEGGSSEGESSEGESSESGGSEIPPFEKGGQRGDFCSNDILEYRHQWQQRKAEL